MPIVNFADAFSTMVGAVQAAADAARYLRNTSGDIQTYAVANIWTTQQAANNAAATALAIASANQAAAGDTLPLFVGAPQTVEALTSGYAAIQTASAAFTAAFTTWRDANLSAADIWAIGSSTMGGVTSQLLRMAP
ncbi:hypothetical protein FGG78_42200, partial [Thioclava sp. BHET1]